MMKDIKIDYIDLQIYADKWNDFKESISSFIRHLKFDIINFFPGDFVPRLLLALMGVVFVLFICKLYEINKKVDNN